MLKFAYFRIKIEKKPPHPAPDKTVENTSKYTTEIYRIRHEFVP